MIDENFLQRIENPEKPGLENLFEKSRKDIKKEFLEQNIEIDDETLKKSTYTYYHNWDEEEPRFGFFLQNPGRLKPRHEGKDLYNASHPLEYVNVYQRYAAEWFIEKNDHFAKKFFPLLHEFGLISLSDWETYVKDEFFDNFYMTDLVKYCVTTKEIKKQHRSESYEKQLRHELEYIDLDLVFSFSSRMWKTLYEQVSTISPVSEQAPESDSVSNCHGYLYRAEEPLDCHIIPLSHYSKQIYGHYLRDSYFNYLREGLDDFNERN